jgi:hypothetical protein
MVEVVESLFHSAPLIYGRGELLHASGRSAWFRQVERTAEAPRADSRPAAPGRCHRAFPLSAVAFVRLKAADGGCFFSCSVGFCQPSADKMVAWVSSEFAYLLANTLGRAASVSVLKTVTQAGMGELTAQTSRAGGTSGAHQRATCPEALRTTEISSAGQALCQSQLLRSTEPRHIHADSTGT